VRRLVLLCALAGLVTGCGGGGAPPEVTFAAGAASVVAKPTQYCDVKLQDCRSDANAPVRLEEISSSPWQVVFTYRSANGGRTDGRSPVLTPDRHPDYTLQLPAVTDALVTAEVQQYGPPPQANAETGELEFPIRATWVLNTSG
jgi:hypothetical protein